jgi:hypothetical protein
MDVFGPYLGMGTFLSQLPFLLATRGIAERGFVNESADAAISDVRSLLASDCEVPLSLKPRNDQSPTSMSAACQQHRSEE